MADSPVQGPKAPLDEDQLAALRGLTSPAVSDAIEMFGLRPRNTGFMTSEIKAILVGPQPMVGYVCTSIVRSREAPAVTMRDGKVDLDLFREYSTAHTFTYLSHALQVPRPRISVVQDIDPAPPSGAWIGEVIGNLHRAMGFSGVVTNGGVRDIDEIESTGLAIFAPGIVVSHAYVHHVASGGPVEVGGLVVWPGDLLHGDKHGVVQIPLEIAPRLVAAAQEIAVHERSAIAGFREAADDLTKVRKIWDELRKSFVA